MQSTIGTPSDIDHLVNHDFESYYSEHPAASFALQVWVNNSWVAAQCIAFAILLGLPIPFVLFQNAANVGVIGGLMFHAGKADVLFGLLTAARTARTHRGVPGRGRRYAAGLVGDLARRPAPRPGARRAGPGRGRRSRSGLVAVLLVSGLIEALVTPSPLPTFVRIGIGVLAEVAFLAYVVLLRPPGRAGRRDR